VAFNPRPIGNTLRRQDEFVRAIHQPHDPRERFDGNFPVMMRCELCGEVGMAGRAEVREAMAEHQRSYCKSRRRRDEPTTMRIAYPTIKE
jgi:hypothetical protein